MTKIQKDFIVNHFFKSDGAAGWENIGCKLVEDGECIVAGLEPIWIGGIGNFIDVSKAENAIGCSLYKFNMKDFLKSNWFISYRESSIDKLDMRIVEFEKELKELKELG